MPLDITPTLFKLKEELDFHISYEDSKLSGHKFGFNINTGEAISHTKNTFNCVSHPTFFNKVKDVIMLGSKNWILSPICTNFCMLHYTFIFDRHISIHPYK